MFSGLVCRGMNDDILGGIPFIEDNNIDVLGSEKCVVFSDGSRFSYKEKTESQGSVRQVHPKLVRATGSSKTVFPGEFLELDLPEEFHDERFPIAI